MTWLPGTFHDLSTSSRPTARLTNHEILPTQSPDAKHKENDGRSELNSRNCDDDTRRTNLWSRYKLLKLFTTDSVPYILEEPTIEAVWVITLVTKEGMQASFQKSELIGELDVDQRSLNHMPSSNSPIPHQHMFQYQSQLSGNLKANQPEACNNRSKRRAWAHGPSSLRPLIGMKRHP